MANMVNAIWAKAAAFVTRWRSVVVLIADAFDTVQRGPKSRAIKKGAAWPLFLNAIFSALQTQRPTVAVAGSGFALSFFLLG